MVQIFIVSTELVDSPIELNTEDNVTCIKIKNIISEKYNIPVKNQKISMFGQIISDNMTLSEAAYVTNPPYYVNFSINSVENSAKSTTESTNSNKKHILTKKNEKKNRRNKKDNNTCGEDLIIKLKGNKRTVFIVKQLKQDLIIKVNDGLRTVFILNEKLDKKYDTTNAKKIQKSKTDVNSYNGTRNIRKYSKKQKLTEEELDKDLDNYFKGLNKESDINSYNGTRNIRKYSKKQKLTEEELNGDLDNYFKGLNKERDEFYDTVDEFYDRSEE